MPYTIRFSDPTKESITVPDMPPGINTIDTSLSLVGRGYPNYGQKIAENFVLLLENFANVLPPQNPIEGQLWYDTSDPNNKVLRINDGTGNQSRWPSATGIYQQGTDPKDSVAGLKVGDIWVDTVKNQLKIYNSNEWTVVGPVNASGGEKTGPEVVTLKDISDPPLEYPVILNWVSGQVITIIAKDQFTPRSTIEGFSFIRPGVNLSSRFSSIFNGTALTSQNLLVDGQNFAASKFLRKDDTTPGAQAITGNVIWQLPAGQTGWQKRDGIVMLRGSSLASSEYLQIVKLDNDAHFINNTPGGNIIFRVLPSASSGQPQVLTSIVTLGSKSVGVNTSTSANFTLDVYGSARVLNTLTLASTANIGLQVAGGANFDGSAFVNNNLKVSGLFTASQTVYVGGDILPQSGTQSIGAVSQPFNAVYANIIGTGTNTFIYGRLKGPADRLASTTQFRMQGQISAPSFTFGGVGGKSVESIALNAGVNGAYTTTATIIFSEPELTGGSRAKANIVVSTTTFEIVSVELVDGGNGYLNAPTVTISPATTGTTATFTITLTEANQGATFNASLTTSAISSQTAITTASTATTLLVLENNNLSKITRQNFLKDVSFTGMITAYGGSTAPDGWLICDGTTSLSSATYAALYNVIGFTYGGSDATGFDLPNLSSATTATGGYPITYIIKI